jgi:hypothetical protein
LYFNGFVDQDLTAEHIVEPASVLSFRQSTLRLFRPLQDPVPPMPDPVIGAFRVNDDFEIFVVFIPAHRGPASLDVWRGSLIDQPPNSST